MQQTALPRCDTARRTAHSEQLFCREVALPHLHTVRQNQPQNYPISNTIRHQPSGTVDPTRRANRTSDFSCPVRDLPVLIRRALLEHVSPFVRQDLRRGWQAGKQLIPPDGV